MNIEEINEKALKLHSENKGKLSVISKVEINNNDDLALAYTPGVAKPCLEIAKNKEDVYKYTTKANMIAVVTDGSAVLGLGDIGPCAALPVMEGKCALFKKFADVDAIPICLDTKDVDEIIKTVKLISPGLGGINLEDISAPRCFEIEERLKSELDIPVFHDDQHGTAIVTVAALINALKIVNKKFEDIRVVINGAGAAGISIAKLLQSVGVKDLVLCNRQGVLNPEDNLDEIRLKISKTTNPYKRYGSLAKVIEGADVFIGVSGPNSLTSEMVSSMNKDSIVLAMANPVPEIYPEEAKKGGARIVGTGRSDYPNQVNNVLAFPAIFRGALDAKATKITEEMKLTCAYGIANAVKNIDETHILPSAFEENLAMYVASLVSRSYKENKIIKE